jgi:hypothetical protein
MPNAIDSMVTLAESLAANGKEVKVTVLKQRGPRKGETWTRGRSTSAGMVAGRALGSVKGGDTTTKATIAGGGREQTMTKVCGIGKEMVKDLDSVKRRYASDAKRLRRDAVLNG